MYVQSSYQSNPLNHSSLCILQVIQSCVTRICNPTCNTISITKVWFIVCCSFLFSIKIYCMFVSPNQSRTTCAYTSGWQYIITQSFQQSIIQYTLSQTILHSTYSHTRLGCYPDSLFYCASLRHKPIWCLHPLKMIPVMPLHVWHKCHSKVVEIEKRFQLWMFYWKV